MTIACCYVSPEGVVFGADSTASYGLSDGPHYFNHAQKIFEVGENGTMAAMFWGLGGLGEVSYRTLLAILADDLEQNPPADVADVATRWANAFYAAYDDALTNDPYIKALGDTYASLAANGARTPEEEEQFQGLRLQLATGSCIGGYVLPSRTPSAYFLHLDPSLTAPPAPAPVPINMYGFWGAPNMARRLIVGADDDTKQSILASGHWTGSATDLDDVLAPHALQHPILPLRDVVDFVHMCIHSTIRALKFSHFQQICGGPIELAVISTDRKFRWVRHKDWAAAVVDGGPT